jgi:hypothetical protein
VSYTKSGLVGAFFLFVFCHASCVSTDVANKDGLEVLPHPREFLGGLVKDLDLAEKIQAGNDPESGVDESASAASLSEGEQKVLRETDSDVYKTFLRYFGGCGMKQSRWRSKSNSLMYHEIVNPTMEAFLVLCYVNVWSCAVSMNIHANNQRVTHPAHVFTAEGKGSPLRGGWSRISRELYLEMVEKIRSQRAADVHHRFDIDLLDLIQRHYRCSRRRGQGGLDEVVDINAFADFIEL